MSALLRQEVLADGRHIRIARVKAEVVITPLAVSDGRHHPKLEGVNQDADVALEAWARWARAALNQLGWPAWTLVARVAEFGVTGAAARYGGSICVEADQLCEMIERIIMRLKEIDRRVTVTHYLYWQPIEASARHCSMTSGRFRTILCRARREVAHRLDGAKIALQQNCL